jgi:hypothetical protein
MISTLIDRLGESNPQLFREVKGRLNGRNLVIASGISLVVQLLIYLYYRASLPATKAILPTEDIFNRYCVGSPPEKWTGYTGNPPYCVKDLLGNWMLNWQLWWLDVFICLSIIGIFALLAAGTWMLISDLSREEQRGTLNFIRLSPRSAKNILLGKMLGVPILLYIAVGLIAPLHLVAGLSAHIPLWLILAFYSVVAASCAFFYSTSLLFGLVTTGLGGFQAWLGSGIVLFFLFCLTGFSMSGIPASHTPFDGMALLYPGTILPYLVHATFLPPNTVGYWAFDSQYSDSSGLVNLKWYGHSLWNNAFTGIGFVLLQYGLWTYWVGQGIKRRFHNPLTTLWSKGQSYVLSGCFAVIILGFTLQTTESSRLFDNFYMLQTFVMFLFLILMAGLSPQRQTLQDWARYRHQVSRDRRNLLKDLVWGEKSPSMVAIAINLAIVTAFIVPSILLFPLEDNKIQVLVGTLFNVSSILFYAAITQLMLMMKSQKRTIWASATVTAMIFLPLGMLALFASANYQKFAEIGLFSLASVWAVEHVSKTTICLSLLGQWLGIAAINFQITRQLQKTGESSSKALMSGSRDKAIA